MYKNKIKINSYLKYIIFEVVIIIVINISFVAVIFKITSSRLRIKSKS